MNSIAHRTPQRLTKSRFSLGLDCPTKLYYAADMRYANQSADDPFLAALAEGGYQVGELAKAYFPGGIEITATEVDAAVAETQRYLLQDTVTLFEAAIEFQNCLVRVDVLVKVGSTIELYEVKAKSFDSTVGAIFQRNDGGIRPAWKPYLYDVAFQKWVVRKAYPACAVSAHLMLADTSQRASTDGLNQHFPIVTDDQGRKRVEPWGTLTSADLQPQIITAINVDGICADIYASNDHGLGVVESFTDMVNRFSNACTTHQRLNGQLGKECGKCEFQTKAADKQAGLLDGRAECFQIQRGFDPAIFDEPTVFDLWAYLRKDQLIADGILRLRDVTEDDINFKGSDVGLSRSERQWLQVEKVKHNDDTIHVELADLKSEMASWTYPLHFIDFETTMVAVPFCKGHRPYEGIAFQFSHHIVEADGSVRHAGQYLNTQRGVFPNYAFVRALRAELMNDNGTIFRYSPHENTYLNIIVEQLLADPAPPADRDQLIDFIKQITKSKNDAVNKWAGPREMVDLWEVVKRYYYDPRTNGSNSIKAVLPAVISRSAYLQKRYSSPIYGNPSEIPSHNFKDWTWIRQDAQGAYVDPYEQLPKLFEDLNDENIKLLTESDALKNGGAALTAYSRMQFEAMSDYERNALSAALLKYCELDTLAMVMIYEHWQHDL